MPQGKPMSGELYRHFKNKMYQIVGIVIHSETREKMVCYQALYGDYGMYVRPYDMFISEVDHVKYPEITQKYRFEYLGRSAGEPAASSEKAAEPTLSVKVETPVQAESSVIAPGAPVSLTREDSMDNLLAFLDAEDVAAKLKILDDMEEKDFTDSLIDSMAVSIDLVIPEGKIDDRIDQLKYALRTRARYEAEGISSRFRVNVRK